VLIQLPKQQSGSSVRSSETTATTLECNMCCVGLQCPAEGSSLTNRHLSGSWSNTWKVVDSTIMRKLKWLFVYGYECRTPTLLKSYVYGSPFINYIFKLISHNVINERGGRPAIWFICATSVCVICWYEIPWFQTLQCTIVYKASQRSFTGEARVQSQASERGICDK
jgi:hypothetical protein